MLVYNIDWKKSVSLFLIYYEFCRIILGCKKKTLKWVANKMKSNGLNLHAIKE